MVIPVSCTERGRWAYEARKNDLDEAVKAFSKVDGQTGFLAVVGGEAIGCDVVSLESAYEKLHGKLFRSYLMEAFLAEAKSEAYRSRRSA